MASRRLALVGLVVLMAYAAIVLVGASSSRAVAAASCPSGAQTFSSTGEQCYTVGSGVDHLLVTATGGPGGLPDTGGTPAHGAQVTAIVPVTPGETLYADVGGAGGNGHDGCGCNGGFVATAPGAGGWNGGASGGGGFAWPGSVTDAGIFGGGGGGASDLTMTSQSVSDALVVAGGGGGHGGRGSGAGGAGAASGTSSGGAGTAGAGTACTYSVHGSDRTIDMGGKGGSGATSGAAGAGGPLGTWNSALCPGLSVTPGNAGAGGTQPAGGAGAGAVGSSYAGQGGAGGGGGGGYYGGGGGGSAATDNAGHTGGGGGGGAGSSYIEPSALNTSVGPDATGTPEVSITPVVAPGPPTSVSASAVPPGASVSFTGPASDGGMPITGYTVTAIDETHGSAPAVTAGGSSSPIQIPGLTAGDTYHFTVSATNLIGTGQPSAASNSVTVQVAPTITSLAVSSGPYVVAQPVTFTATVFPVPDGGYVTFRDGLNTLTCGARPIAADGTATCQAPFPTAGLHTVTAFYSGDPNYSSSSSTAPALRVNPAPTTTTLSANQNPGVVNGYVQFRATVSPVPDGGTVAFSVGGKPIGCSAQLVGPDGTSTCTVHEAAAGTQSVAASYSGNADYVWSASSPMNEVVVAAPTSTALSSPTANPSVGQPVTYTATVAPVPDGGTVAFADAGSPISGCGSQAVGANGKATCAVSYAAVGAHSVTAAYGGDTNFSPSSSAAVSKTISPASTTTGLGVDHSPALVGQAVTYTATVAPVPDGGTVAFTDAGSPISGCGSQAVGADGKATCAVSYAAVGAHSVTAAYGGDPNYVGSASSATSEIVSPASTTTGIAVDHYPAALGQAVMYTATVAPVPDGGTVAFTDAGSPISGCGSQAVGADGTATCAVTYRAAGAHSVTAAYGGDANYVGSASSATSEIVSPASTTTGIAVDHYPAALGQPVTYTATVAPVPDGGTVAFTDAGSPISGCGSQAVGADGTATCAVTYAAAGAHSVTAAYGGDSNYQGSSSTPMAETVNPLNSSSGGDGGSGSGSGSNSGGGQSTSGGSGAGSTAPSTPELASGAKVNGLGLVSDTISCVGSQPCTVTETLTTTVTMNNGHVASASAARLRVTHRTVVVGTRTVTIGAGKTMTVSVSINTAGRSLMVRLGKLPITLTVATTRSGKLVVVAQRRLTVKPPAGGHKKH